MVEKVVRCPYCVLGDNFMEMVPHLDGRMICRKCGHVVKNMGRRLQVRMSEVPGDEVRFSEHRKSSCMVTSPHCRRGFKWYNSKAMLI
jgi:hypothetical protein